MKKNKQNMTSWLLPKKIPQFGVNENTLLKAPLFPKPKYRSVWISDVHLGTKNCQADVLLDFFRRVDSRYLYLVGDIIDGWQLRKSWYWPQSHNDVIQKILKKARKGTRVIFIPGNHDEFLRAYTPHHFGRVSLVPMAIHQTADGKRFLVLHGDQFDGVMQHAKWLAKLGDEAYEIALRVNHWFNWIRGFFGMDYWSLSSYLKQKVKNAVNFISTYEDVVSRSAQKLGVDGVICGHIHKAEMKDMSGILYMNDGDWVESSTVLVEHWDGRMEIIDWQKQTANRQNIERGVLAVTKTSARLAA